MTFIEQRVEPRETMALPLRLGDDVTAVTRDISPSGMYFRIIGAYSVAGRLLFEMDLVEANMKFTAEGEIIRLEHREGWTGVAVRLLSPHIALLVENCP